MADATSPRRFARVVAHDLRSPLTKVRAFAEALREDLGPRLEGSDAELLSFLVDCTDEVQAKVERLSVWGRLEAIEAEVDVDLDACLTEVLPADAEVERVSWPTIRGSADPCRLLLQELVTNAERYGGGPWRCTRDGDVLGLMDRGPGIPAEHRERALEPLQRLVPVRSVPGSGLGLAIAARVAELHGGRLWIEAGDDGVGTHVRFTLGPAV